MSRTDMMKTYIPRYLLSSRVITSILNGEGTEIDTLYGGMNSMLQQFYAETATEVGLTLWEHMLSLQNNSGETIEERRSNVVAKLRGVGTVNISLVKKVAESYVYGAVDIIQDSSPYSLIIKFIDTRGVPSNLDDVKKAIELIKPAHLAVSYEFTYSTWAELGAVPWLNLQSYTWEQIEVRAWS